MTQTFDFTTSINRADTGSLKWDKYKGTDIPLLWVADMDFVSPPAVLQALRDRVEHGVYGYTKSYPSVENAFLSYLEREHRFRRCFAAGLAPGLVPALNVAARPVVSPRMR